MIAVMNIVEEAIKKAGDQQKLAAALTAITGHPYKQGHVSYWKKVGYFPSDIADVVAERFFEGEITAREACPKIKQPVAA